MKPIKKVSKRRFVCVCPFVRQQNHLQLVRLANYNFPARNDINAGVEAFFYFKSLGKGYLAHQFAVEVVDVDALLFSGGECDAAVAAAYVQIIVRNGCVDCIDNRVVTVFFIQSRYAFTHPVGGVGNGALYARMIGRPALLLACIGAAFLKEGGIVFKTFYKCIRNNWDLSALRASSVVQALQNTYGVDPKRLTAGGRGEYNPVASNNTEAGKQRNRRTQIIITPKLDQFMDLIDEAPESE